MAVTRSTRAKNQQAREQRAAAVERLVEAAREYAARGWPTVTGASAPAAGDRADRKSVV